MMTGNEPVKNDVKTMKYAFIGSVVSLLCCVLSFAGTTYAWFTAVVSNTGNRIESGMMDVAIVDAEGERLNDTDLPLYELNICDADGHTGVLIVNPVREDEQNETEGETELTDDDGTATENPAVVVAEKNIEEEENPAEEEDSASPDLMDDLLEAVLKLEQYQSFEVPEGFDKETILFNKAGILVRGGIYYLPFYIKNTGDLDEKIKLIAAAEDTEPEEVPEETAEEVPAETESPVTETENRDGLYTFRFYRMNTDTKKLKLLEFPPVSEEEAEEAEVSEDHYIIIPAEPRTENVSDTEEPEEFTESSDNSEHLEGPFVLEVIVDADRNFDFATESDAEEIYQAGKIRIYAVAVQKSAEAED